MIDLHLHSVFSDGELVPAEICRRTRELGLEAIAITDHVDVSNVDFITEALVRFCDFGNHGLRVLPGVEVTHVRPADIEKVAHRARVGGAQVIVVHGESPVEPVEEGTNSAAADAGADILAHPGLITPETALQAAKAGMALEISGRGGHSFTNGHVAAEARKAGAKMVFNSDAHSPRDLMDRDMALKVLLGAGLDQQEAEQVFGNSREIVEAKIGAL